jgi:hypothetical protein
MRNDSNLQENICTLCRMHNLEHQKFDFDFLLFKNLPEKNIIFKCQSCAVVSSFEF